MGSGHDTEFHRKRYRGLCPAMPLILRFKGSDIELQAKWRTGDYRRVICALLPRPTPWEWYSASVS